MAAEAAVSALNTESLAKEGQVAAKSAELQRLQAQANEELSRRDTYTRQIGTLNQTKMAAEAAVSELNALIASKSAELSSKQAELADVTTTQTANLAEKRAEVQEATEEVERLQSLARAESTKIDRFNTEITTLNSVYENTNAALAQKQAELATKQEEVDAESEELAMLQQQVSKKQTDISTYNTQVNTLSGKKETLNTEVAGLLKMVNELNTLNDEKQDEIEEKKKTFDDLTLDVEELLTQEQTLTGNTNALTLQMTNLTTEINSSINIRNELLQQVTELRAMIDGGTAAFENQNVSLNSLQEQVAQKTERLFDIDNTLTGLEEEKQGLLEQNATFDAQTKQLQAAVQTAQAQLGEVEEQKEIAQAVYEDMALRTEEMHLAGREAFTAMEQLTARNKQLVLDHEAATLRYQELEEYYADFATAEEEKKQRLAAEIKALEAKVTQLSEIETLTQSQMQNLVNTYQQMQSGMDAEFAERQEQMVTVITGLNSEVQSAQGRLDQIGGAIANAESQYKEVAEANAEVINEYNHLSQGLQQLQLQEVTDAADASAEIQTLQAQLAHALIHIEQLTAHYDAANADAVASNSAIQKAAQEQIAGMAEILKRGYAENKALSMQLSKTKGAQVAAEKVLLKQTSELTEKQRSNVVAVERQELAVKAANAKAETLKRAAAADTTRRPAENARATLAQLDTRLFVQQKAMQKSAVALEETSAQQSDAEEASLDPTLVIGAFGAFMLLALLF